MKGAIAMKNKTMTEKEAKKLIEGLTEEQKKKLYELLLILKHGN